MINRYKIYSELNFGVAKLEPGIKSFEEIFQLAKDFREDPDFSKVHFQLNDLRGCSFDFKLSKISSMVSLIEEYQNLDNQKIGVYIIDKPFETAYMQLFQNSVKYKRDFCSTVEKSYNLLDLKISFKEFEKLINI
ncbi:MAG: hypothetical protein GQ564_03705 [Bacteroidales bacterium]|nr:hypothetical protein [Bacteroidales bacterium]